MGVTSFWVVTIFVCVVAKPPKPAEEVAGVVEVLAPKLNPKPVLGVAALLVAVELVNPKSGVAVEVAPNDGTAVVVAPKFGAALYP